MTATQERTKGSNMGQSRPNVKDLDSYIENRARILRKTYQDHVAWERRLKVSSVSHGASLTWFDHEGRRHTTLINEEYMQTHWRVIRSVILDLAECGPAGHEVLRVLVERQRPAPRELQARQPRSSTRNASGAPPEA